MPPQQAGFVPSVRRQPRRSDCAPSRRFRPFGVLPGADPVAAATQAMAATALAWERGGPTIVGPRPSERSGGVSGKGTLTEGLALGLPSLSDPPDHSAWSAFVPAKEARRAAGTLGTSQGRAPAPQSPRSTTNGDWRPQAGGRRVGEAPPGRTRLLRGAHQPELGHDGGDVPVGAVRRDLVALHVEQRH